MNESHEQFQACIECATDFPITDRERQWFLDHGLVPPKRCKACRAAKRARNDEVIATSLKQQQQHG